MIGGDDLRRVQRRLLEMGKVVAEILERHDIPYIIAYGTLLGAVRHRGFVPWDDDFDLQIVGREAYPEAIRVLRAELPEDLLLEDAQSEPRYFHGWARVKDLRTEIDKELYPQDAAYRHHGLNLDLYRLDEVKRGDLWKHLNDEHEQYLMRRREKGLLSEADYAIRRETLNRNRLLENDTAALAADTKCHDGEEIVYVMLNGGGRRYLCGKEIFPRIRYLFEDRMFYGPAAANSVLTEIYGNFMAIPSEEYRHAATATVRFLEE